MGFQVVVDNILDVDSIKIVSPWMKNLEALMLDVLFSVSLNILSEELKAALISLDWVAEIIFIDCFLVISQE